MDKVTEVLLMVSKPEVLDTFVELLTKRFRISNEALDDHIRF